MSLINTGDDRRRPGKKDEGEAQILTAVWGWQKWNSQKRIATWIVHPWRRINANPELHYESQCYQNGLIFRRRYTAVETGNTATPLNFDCSFPLVFWRLAPRTIQPVATREGHSTLKCVINNFVVASVFPGREIFISAKQQKSINLHSTCLLRRGTSKEKNAGRRWESRPAFSSFFFSFVLGSAVTLSNKRSFRATTFCHLWSGVILGHPKLLDYYELINSVHEQRSEHRAQGRKFSAVRMHIIQIFLRKKGEQNGSKKKEW